jgi:hypothetical protein
MKLDIETTEQQNCKDGMHRAPVQNDALQVNDCSQLSLERFVQQQPHPASIMGSLRSIKRMRKPG